MNCKPGDIAFVVGPTTGVAKGLAGYEETFDWLPRGSIVEVVSFAWLSTAKHRRVMWNVTPKKVAVSLKCGISCSAKVVAVADCILKPIRPGDGEDEMLRIAGRPAPFHKPQPVTEGR